MSEIIIHIGTHKTGTTTIQDTLFHNRQLLAAHGVVYPRIGLMAPHHTLATHWIDLPAQFRARRPAAASWATLARAYAGSDKTVLISSEEFSRQQPVPVDFRELRGFVEGFGRKRIACAFRNQLGYLQSIYVQVTKSQAFVDFDYFFGQCMRWRYATGLALDYNVLLDQILAGFGRDEVILIPYERAIAEDGLVASFCRKLGLPVESAALEPLPAGDSNVSPTALALWLANQAAAPGVATARQVALAGQVLERALGKGARTTLYTRGQVARLRRTFMAANRRFQIRCREIDPDFAMTSLRLAEGTIYRDDLDVPGLLQALERAAAPAPAQPPAPAAAAIPPTPPAPPAPPAAPAVRVPAAPSLEAFRARPSPLALSGPRMVVCWSPKSACSHAVLWTFLHEGLLAEAVAYNPWPHEYRMHVYYRLERYRRLSRAVSATGGRGHTLLKITRDPHKRLVSMFRHACRFPFMAATFRERLGIDLETDGISLRDFGTVLGELPLMPPTDADSHLWVQYHPVWDWDFDRVITVNIDQTDLDAALNAVEAEFGLPVTDFAAEDAFARLRKQHYAVPARLDPDGAIEDYRFRPGAVRRFPTAQLLQSPLVAELVERCYAIDIGSTDVADTAGILFRGAPEPVS